MSQLTDKYGDVYILAQALGTTNLKAEEENGHMTISGTCPTRYAADQVWSKVKEIDPSLSHGDLTLNLEAARIGFNDISQKYAIDEAQRAIRLKTLLESVLYTFVEPAGAMRSTQNPHIVDFKGVITISYEVVPAPCISPLKTEFSTDVQQVADAINTLHPDAVEVKSFASLGEFAQIMADLTKTATPLSMPVALKD